MGKTNQGKADRHVHSASDHGGYASSQGFPPVASTCTAVIGSMTQAMKAQTLLADAAIRCTMTKISSAETHNGCAYGVDYPCLQQANVRMVLERGGIRVRQYLQG